MTPDELEKYAQENGERFWRDAGQHWLNDRFDLRFNSRVIEIGGYLGDWTDYVQKKYECFVDVYEPVKEHSDRLFQRFSNRPKIQVFNCAVDSFDGKANIAVMGEGSSMYNGGVGTGPMVFVQEASRIVQEMGEVDLLAVNGEGCEYHVLNNLIYNSELSRVRQLLVQFHTFFPDAEARRASIREGLALTHYEQWAYPFCWEMWVRK